MDSKGNKPLAKVEGLQYSNLSPYLNNIQKPYLATSQDAANNSADPLSYANTKDIELRGYVSQMRKDLTNALITSYTYDSYDNLKTITSPSGTVEYYQYDNLHRLTKITDQNGKILKEYNYNYTTNSSGNYPFLLEEITNEERKFPYLKNNCINGQIGDVYYYTIPAGTYKSLIGAADLNIKVYNDAIQNGQTYANLYGACISPSSYGFTSLSTIQLHTSSLNLNGNTVSGYLVFTVLPNYSKQEGSYIAYIPNSLAPSSDRNYSYHETSNGVDRYWSFLIKSNGYVYATVNGTNFNGSSISINSFQYQK
ncbi:DUF5977 domain-containing protein [Chryseobacterium shandongense]|uniref:DUF5977 domain-containing protein n=1 Tax=Chryseobacterium shandongense TaxID=1493872 RepID=UPI000F4F92F0|nr:DUF5977 domain-containing protein [Chryseobacterium shandongense]AZA56570.1 hypothetical protein EG350_05000 [Chryseobacterium shandongense]